MAAAYRAALNPAHHVRPVERDVVFDFSRKVAIEDGELADLINAMLRENWDATVWDPMPRCVPFAWDEAGQCVRRFSGLRWELDKDDVKLRGFVTWVMKEVSDQARELIGSVPRNETLGDIPPGTKETPERAKVRLQNSRNDIKRKKLEGIEEVLLRNVKINAVLVETKKRMADRFPEHDFDSDEMTVGFLGQTMRVVDGRVEMSFAKPSDKITSIIPYTPRWKVDGQPDCDFILAWLRARFGEHADEMIAFIGRLEGSMQVALDRERIVFLVGEGGSGKSSLARILMMGLGQYGLPTFPRSIIERVNGRMSGASDSDTFGLRNKRGGVLEEASDAHWSIDAFGQFAGNPGRVMNVRAPYGSANVEFRIWLQLLIPTNDLPEMKGNAKAIDRRCAAIEMNEPWAPANYRAFWASVEQDIPGFIAFGIDSLADIAADGEFDLRFPLRTIEHFRDLHAERNELSEWLRERCIYDEGSKELARDLLADYNDWAMRHYSKVTEKHQMSAKGFGGKVSKDPKLKPSRGFFEGSEVRAYQGIRLRAPNDRKVEGDIDFSPLTLLTPAAPPAADEELGMAA